LPTPIEAPEVQAGREYWLASKVEELHIPNQLPLIVFCDPIPNLRGEAEELEEISAGISLV
jgi:hypothetical protein